MVGDVENCSKFEVPTVVRTEGVSQRNSLLVSVCDHVFSRKAASLWCSKFKLS
jgi:hypothetical protein